MSNNNQDVQVIHLRFPHLKTLTVILGVGRGGCFDAISGSTRVTLGIMTRASRHYSEDRVIELTDGYGSILSHVLGSDHAGLRLKTLPEYFDPHFFLELITEPLFTEFTLNREREFARQELLQVQSDPFSRHILLARKNIHAGEVLGNPVIGDVEALNDITLDHVIKFHQSEFFVNPKLAVLCGNDINNKHVEVLEDALTTLPKNSLKTPPKAPVRDSPILLQEEELNQVYMSVTLKGPPESSSDYLSFLLGSHVLGGGGLGNRLGTEIREKRGLAYHAGVLYLKDKTVVDLMALTFTTPANATECLSLMVNEIKKLAVEPIPDEELNVHKAELAGQLLQLMDSSSQLALHYFTKSLRNADPDIDKQIRKINNISAQDIMKTYARLLDDNTLYLTVNGKIPKDFAIPDLNVKL